MHGPLNVKFVISTDTVNPVDTCYATQDWQQVYHNNNTQTHTHTHKTREHISMSQYFLSDPSALTHDNT